MQIQTGVVALKQLVQKSKHQSGLILVLSKTFIFKGSINEKKNKKWLGALYFYTRDSSEYCVELGREP
jgi:hypothetical protein